MDEYDFFEAGIHGPDVDDLWNGMMRSVEPRPKILEILDRTEKSRTCRTRTHLYWRTKQSMDPS